MVPKLDAVLSPHASVFDCFNLSFYCDMAHASDDQVGIRFAFFDRQQVYRICLVVRAEDQIVGGPLHILDGTATIFAHGVHVLLALSLWLEGIIVTVDEDGSAGEQPWIHAHAFARVHLHHDEAAPVTTR